MKYRVFITDNKRGDITEIYDSNTIEIGDGSEDAISTALEIIEWNKKLTVVIKVDPEE